jgi:Holliday junction resolvase RusA-like endonuclease
MTRRRIAFTVIGIPQPQGSATAFVPYAWARTAVRQKRAPRAIVTHDNPKVRGWRQLVAEQAQTVVGEALFLGPVVLTVTFRLPRPISLPKKTHHHTTTPDLDKLVRAIGDGLSGVVLLDDKQIVDLHARKVYTSGARPPSASIVVEDADLPDIETPDLFADPTVFEEVPRNA